MACGLVAILFKYGKKSPYYASMHRFPAVRISYVYWGCFYTHRKGNVTASYRRKPISISIPRSFIRVLEIYTLMFSKFNPVVFSLYKKLIRLFFVFVFLGSGRGRLSHDGKTKQSPSEHGPEQGRTTTKVRNVEVSSPKIMTEAGGATGWKTKRPGETILPSW